MNTPKEQILEHIRKFYGDDHATQVDVVITDEELNEDMPTILVVVEGGVAEIQHLPKENEPTVNVVLVDFDVDIEDDPKFPVARII